MTKKVAAFDQIQHILAKLNIIDEPRDFGNLNGERWQDNAAPLKTGYQYLPYTSTKSAFQPSADDCIELDTTNPFDSTINTKSVHTTTESRPDLWTPDVNAPAVPLTAEELDYIETLEVLIQRSASTIAKARRTIELEIAVLRDLEDNLSFVRYGHEHKEREGTHNSNNASHANTNDTQTSNHSNSNLLSTLAQYQPPTDTTRCPSTDPTGTKYCTVSKPLGEILGPTDGRFYNTGRCDKHADKKEFNGIVLGHVGRERQYMASAHMWKCSGEPTMGTRRETIHRG